jgi:hypothetical protein
MKKILFVFFVLAIAMFVNAQYIGKTVNTKYLRSSLTTLFFQPETSQENIILTRFKELPVISKFDDNKIEFPYFNGSGLSEADKIAKIQRYVQQAANPILAKWWNRDANGDFNTEFVAKRGGFSAIDADVIQAKASSMNRIEMIGADLIDKSYVFVYDITDLLTMEQVYDRTDASGRKYNSNYKPVKRDDEGYEVTYTVYAYRLVFNDSVSSVFYNNYWTDAKNHNAQKAASWSTATFPMIYKTRLSATVRSSQPKDPQSSVYLSKKKKTMTELLQDVAALIQTNSVDGLGMRLKDFKAKVSVFKTKPLSAKLGTKESLYLDQRFFIYEIEQDLKGNQKKVRMGVARVKEIADNNTMASGTTKPSVFQQQGGRKLYEGMLMESNEDMGVGLSVGSSFFGGNQQFSGLNVALDYRISRAAKITGLAVGVDAYVNFLNDVNVGNVSTSYGSLPYSGNVMDGTSYALAVYVAKEMYFTRKGNVYLRPSIGGGLSGYVFTKINDVEIPKVLDDSGKEVQDKNYSWSSIYFPMNIGLGINFSPSICLEIKPGIAFRFASTTGNNEALIQSGTPDAKWGFENLDKVSMNSSIVCNLRFRF